MGLNDIQLNATLLSELYGHSLVLTEGDSTIPAAKVTSKTDAAAELARQEVLPSTAEAALQAGLPFLGNNQKKIAIIVSYNNAAYLPDDALEFLTRMLNACNLSLGDVAIHNFDIKNGYVAKDILAQLQSRVVLLFDIAPDQFGLATQFPPFQVQPLAGVTYLHAPALEECRDDKLLKSKLWVCLQRIFNI